MNDVPRTRPGLVGRGFAAFFRDLANGDTVAICIALGMLAFLVVLAILGAWILWSRKKAADEHQKKIKKLQKRKR